METIWIRKMVASRRLPSATQMHTTTNHYMNKLDMQHEQPNTRTTPDAQKTEPPPAEDRTTACRAGRTTVEPADHTYTDMCAQHTAMCTRRMDSSALLLLRKHGSHPSDSSLGPEACSPIEDGSLIGLQPCRNRSSVIGDAGRAAEQRRPVAPTQQAPEAHCRLHQKPQRHTDH